MIAIKRHTPTAVGVSSSATNALSAIKSKAYDNYLAAMPLPQIEPSSQPQHWFADAAFSHTAHQYLECADCHQKALTSSNGSDLLMPRIATCRRCHDGQSSPQGPPVRTGHAESGCFLCHLYHGPQQGGFADAHPLADISRR
ncbi:MAG: cytochrome c3 family protein [Verrucomicrobiota bacterium]